MTTAEFSMSPARRSLDLQFTHSRKIISLLTLLIVSSTACTYTSEPATASDSGTDAGKSDVAVADSPGAEVSDLAVFPPFVPDPAIECGPGCKIVSGPADPRSHPFAGYGDNIVAGFSPVWYSLTTDVAASVPPQDKHVGLFADVFGTAYAISVDVDKTREEVRVIDLAAHTSETVYGYRRPEMRSVDTIALSPNYVFWQQVGVGLTAFNRKTRTTRTIAPLLDCLYFAGLLLPTAKGPRDTVLCGEVNSTTLLIDAETGEAKRIDGSKAYQLFGNATRNRDRLIWVDYRDEPKEANWDYASGGEIYSMALSAGEAKPIRLTYDSPANPWGKAYPTMDGNLVAWKVTALRNPPAASTLTGANDLWLMDISTRERCHLKPAIGYIYGSRILMFGNKLATTWEGPKTDKIHLAILDLDHPQWKKECDIGPGPKIVMPKP